MSMRLPLIKLSRIPLGTLCLSASLFLGGCATSPQSETNPKATEAATELTVVVPQIPDQALLEKAQHAEATGKYVIAAQDYHRLAELSETPMQERFLLKAANMFIRGNYIDETTQLAIELSNRQLIPSQQIDLRLLSARIGVKRHNADIAFANLDLPASVKLTNNQQLEYFRLLADTYSLTNNPLESARARIQIDARLEDPHLKLQNRLRLWQSLSSLDLSTLQAHANKPDSSENLRGWLELAYYINNTALEASQLEAQIEYWNNRYLTHPATEFVPYLLDNRNELSGRPQQIAVLLPLTGTFATPAKAIRDGFLAAYFSRQDTDYQPDIRFYDTEGDVEKGLQLYQQAIDDGASFIVGPLHKPTVEALTQQATLDTPTLALNYAQSENIHRDLFQFGLLPEDEARQVAERAWLDGYDRALLLTPSGEWGDRLRNAFIEHWQQLNGILIEAQSYDSSQSDFSGPVKNLLNIDKSKQRYRALKQLLHDDIKFEPRRRQDADFVFVAAFPKQARQIRPQMKFFYASDMPLYSTSHVYTGTPNSTQDRDMDGIQFCDMPWTLKPDSDDAQTWKDIEELWPKVTSLKRLYAMGVDAYQLTPWLRYLQSNNEEHLAGKTGNLYLDDTNRVHRQLLWAKFHRGLPRLMESTNQYYGNTAN